MGAGTGDRATETNEENTGKQDECLNKVFEGKDIGFCTESEMSPGAETETSGYRSRETEIETETEAGDTEEVVPLGHVEAVLERVIPDPSSALTSLQTKQPEQCVTKRDLHEAFSSLKVQIVQEIRSNMLK